MWFDPRREIPNFSAPAFFGSSDRKKETSMEDFIGRYFILLFLPMDETMEVSLTEVASFSPMQDQAHDADHIIFGIVPRSEENVAKLMDKPMGKGGFGGCAFPILCDESRRISLAFHLDNKGGVSRGICIIGRHRYMRFKSVYHRHVGRNAEEAFRVLDALRNSDKIRKNHSILIDGKKVPRPRKAGTGRPRAESGETMMDDEDEDETVIDADTRKGGGESVSKQKTPMDKTKAGDAEAGKSGMESRSKLKTPTTAKTTGEDVETGKGGPESKSKQKTKSAVVDATSGKDGGESKSKQKTPMPETRVVPTETGKSGTDRKSKLKTATAKTMSGDATGKVDQERLKDSMERQSKRETPIPKSAVVDSKTGKGSKGSKQNTPMPKTNAEDAETGKGGIDSRSKLKTTVKSKPENDMGKEDQEIVKGSKESKSKQKIQTPKTAGMDVGTGKGGIESMSKQKTPMAKTTGMDVETGKSGMESKSKQKTTKPKTTGMDAETGKDGMDSMSKRKTPTPKSTMVDVKTGKGGSESKIKQITPTPKTPVVDAETGKSGIESKSKQRTPMAKTTSGENKRKSSLERVKDSIASKSKQKTPTDKTTSGENKRKSSLERVKDSIASKSKQKTPTDKTMSGDDTGKGKLEKAKDSMENVKDRMERVKDSMEKAKDSMESKIKQKTPTGKTTSGDSTGKANREKVKAILGSKEQEAEDRGRRKERKSGRADTPTK